MRNTRSAASRLGAAAVIAAAFAACLAVSTPARAQSVGGAIDLGIPTGDTADALGLGWGLEGRAGMGLPLPLITAELEAMFDWYKFPFDKINDAMTLWRAVGGLRLGLGIPFVPDLFAHIGYGKESTQVAGVGVDEGGLTWDLGVAVDLVSLPLISLGIQLAYKNLAPGETSDGIHIDPTTWVGLGIYGEVGF